MVRHSVNVPVVPWEQWDDEDAPAHLAGIERGMVGVLHPETNFPCVGNAIIWMRVQCAHTS